MPIPIIIFISIIGTLLFIGLLFSVISYFSDLNHNNERRDSRLHYLEFSLSYLRSRLNILENKISSYNRFFVVTKKNKIIKTKFSKK